MRRVLVMAQDFAMKGPLPPPIDAATVGSVTVPDDPLDPLEGAGTGFGAGVFVVSRGPWFLRRLGARESASSSSKRKNSSARRHCAYARSSNVHARRTRSDPFDSVTAA
jgi:hypothetical protein